MNLPSLKPAFAAVNQPTLDLERITMLRELCLESDPSMLTEMFESWTKESAERLVAIRAAVAAADAAALKSAAHALKGSCANLGVAKLAEMSRLVEKNAAAADASSVVDDLKSEFDRATAQLSVELQPPAAK